VYQRFQQIISLTNQEAKSTEFSLEGHLMNKSVKMRAEIQRIPYISQHKVWIHSTCIQQSKWRLKSKVFHTAVEMRAEFSGIPRRIIERPPRYLCTVLKCYFCIISPKRREMTPEYNLQMQLNNLYDYSLSKTSCNIN